MEGFAMKHASRVGVALAVMTAAAWAQEPGEKWRVHEWGTFTSLQDEAGRSIGWINTEDEPVPEFCHRLSRSLLVPIDDLAPAFFKGAPRSHPDVFVRLETPVIYFHPPASARLPVSVDVRVEFRGGWLTEYYPDARVTAPGLARTDAEFGRIGAKTVGSLEWKGLRVGAEGGFPKTTDPVWLAPRDVKAAPVTTAAGESERFLFYRGVGHLQAPLVALRRDGGKTISIRGRLPAELAPRAPLRVPRLWFVDIRDDGNTAYRSVPAFEMGSSQDAELASFPAEFPGSAYSPGELASLREEMHQGLVEDGLNRDEAAALLNTWEASYFQSAGLRVFFLVPRAWTDHVLPLKLSVEAEVARAMIGRLELVTPGQRECLKRIVAARESSTAWYYEWMEKHPEARKRFEQRRREGDLQSLRRDCVKIPDNYLAYLGLGRFRNALVLDEYRHRPKESLRGFISTYDLAPASVPAR
jgi:hypothetical protein